MGFILTGFTQEMGVRVFTFERVGADRQRTTHCVKADLALIRRYAIPVQELPLLCRNLLEHDDSHESGTVTFSEQDMRLYANHRASARTAAAQRRKPPGKPSAASLGTAWRGHKRGETVHVQEALSGAETMKDTDPSTPKPSP
jgi:hypothetical protein